MASTLAMSKKPLMVTFTKKCKRSGNIRWMSATMGQARLLISDVEVAVPPLNEVTQKMNVLVTMMSDLSVQIKATEDHLREVAVSPALSQATSPPVRRRVMPRDHFNHRYLRRDLSTRARASGGLSSGTQSPQLRQHLSLPQLSH